MHDELAEIRDFGPGACRIRWRKMAELVHRGETTSILGRIVSRIGDALASRLISSPRRASGHRQYLM